MNENDLNEHNPQCHANLSFFERSGLRSDQVRFLLGGVLVVALGGIIFAVAMVHHRDYLATRANIFARTFINSSPVVEQHLGTVRQVVKVEERHQTGKAAGWYLDYDVHGSQAQGVVDLRLIQSRNSLSWEMPVQWNVPLAILETGNRSVNLR